MTDKDFWSTALPLHDDPLLEKARRLEAARVRLDEMIVRLVRNLEDNTWSQLTPGMRLRFTPPDGVESHLANGDECILAGDIGTLSSYSITLRGEVMLGVIFPSARWKGSNLYVNLSALNFRPVDGMELGTKNEEASQPDKA
jgi:hypothetical protein